MKKQHLTLTETDRIHLQGLLSKGMLSARVYKRIMGLLNLDKGYTYSEVQTLVQVSYPTVLDWSKKYKAEGLNFLQDKYRSGRPLEFTGEDRAKITALACTDAPQGYARWSLRMLADKVVELELVESISFKQVGNILKKTNCSRTENGSGV
jgi:transposase